MKTANYRINFIESYDSLGWDECACVWSHQHIHTHKQLRYLAVGRTQWTPNKKRAQNLLANENGEMLVCSCMHFDLLVIISFRSLDLSLTLFSQVCVLQCVQQQPGKIQCVDCAMEEGDFDFLILSVCVFKWRFLYQHFDSHHSGIRTPNQHIARCDFLSPPCLHQNLHSIILPIFKCEKSAQFHPLFTKYDCPLVIANNLINLNSRLISQHDAATFVQPSLRERESEKCRILGSTEYFMQ